MAAAAAAVVVVVIVVVAVVVVSATSESALMLIFLSQKAKILDMGVSKHNAANMLVEASLPRLV